MKVEIEDIKDNGFKSFRIILDIESIQELRELFCRITIRIDEIKDTMKRERYTKPKDGLLFDKDNTVELHKVLSSKLKEYEQ